MSPKLEALRLALERLDRMHPYGPAHTAARAEMLAAAQIAGFDPRRACEDWARYTVAVAECVDEGRAEEPEPESLALFGCEPEAQPVQSHPASTANPSREINGRPKNPNTPNV